MAARTIASGCGVSFLSLAALVSAAALLSMPCESLAAEVHNTAAISVHRAATERLERRRAVKAGRLQVPLPNTPDTTRVLTRLAIAGLQLGAPVMLRVFKAESELEVWVQKDGAYVPFAVYPICYWSGKIGPKLREGDRQAPEGFYTITAGQLHHGGRWRRSLDIGYPNVFDRVNGRTGSLILVHGGCDSVGCFAMTDAVNAELYDLVSAALRRGQEHVPVHVFPFRMTDANVAAHSNGAWKDFWADLKLGYDAFERTRRAPHVTVCGHRYRIADGKVGGAGEEVALCEVDLERYGSVMAAARAATKGALPPEEETAAKQQAIPCSMALPSCRRWVALRDRMTANGTVAVKQSGGRSRVR